jgi:glycosyltransferase involved in cell wall biosynthesis
MDRDLALVMITYNQENVIEKTIQSVLNLKIFPDEIIIADDFSTDNTFEIIGSYKNDLISKISKVTIYQNKKNLGIYKNWENAIEKVNSNFITACGGDDLLTNDSVYEIKKDLIQIVNRNVILIYNFFIVRGKNKKIWNNFKLKNTDVILSILQNTLSHRNLCISKDILLKSMKQSEFLKQQPDVNYGVDLIKKIEYVNLVDKHVFINKTVGYYISGIGVSSQNIKKRTESESKTYSYLLSVTEKKYHNYIKFRILACKYSLNPFRFDLLVISIYILFMSYFKNTDIQIIRNLKYLIPNFIFNSLKKIIYN